MKGDDKLFGRRKQENKTDNLKIVRRERLRDSKDQEASLSQVALIKGNMRRQHPSLALFTLLVIYKNLYILGINILRRTRRFVRRMRRPVLTLVGAFWVGTEYFARFSVMARKGFIRRVKAPFFRISGVWVAQMGEVKKMRAQGRFPASAYIEVAFALFKFLAIILRTTFNYLAPVAAAWLLIHTINLYVNQSLALRVIYNNEVIGYIQSELEYDRAAQILRERFANESDVSDVFIVPSFTLVVMESEDDRHPLLWLTNRIMSTERTSESFITTPEQLVDNLVQRSGIEVEQAFGLYIDNEFFGAVLDGRAVVEKLEQIREDSMTGAPDETVEFIRRIAFTPGLYPSSAIVPLQHVQNLMVSYEDAEQVYVVQSGDTPTGIATRIGVPYTVLRQLNPGIENNLQPGQQIITQIAQPFLSVRNIHTLIYSEEYNYSIEEVPNSGYAVGYRRITSEGQPGVREVEARVVMINGVEVARDTVDTIVLREAVPQRVIVGTNNPLRMAGGIVTPAPGPGSTAAARGGGFIWPTVGGVATTYPGHVNNAIDIARPAGTPIFAAKDGVVSRVVFGRTGYGLHVVIDHPNGYRTLYAHASAIHVVQGQHVRQGDVIASVGRTGWSTGNHLHFEIIRNGRPIWPPTYVGYRG